MKTAAKDDFEDGDINEDEENFGVHDHQSLQKSADPIRIRFRRIGRRVRRIIRRGKNIIRRGKRIVKKVCHWVNRG